VNIEEARKRLVDRIGVNVGDRDTQALDVVFSALRAAEGQVVAMREALVEIERRLREDAAPLAAVAQASGKREVERAWKAVYSSAIHAQCFIVPALRAATETT